MKRERPDLHVIQGDRQDEPEPRLVVYVWTISLRAALLTSIIPSMSNNIAGSPASLVLRALFLVGLGLSFRPRLFLAHIKRAERFVEVLQAGVDEIVKIGCGDFQPRLFGFALGLPKISIVFKHDTRLSKSGLNQIIAAAIFLLGHASKSAYLFSEDIARLASMPPVDVHRERLTAPRRSHNIRALNSRG